MFRCRMPQIVAAMGFLLLPGIVAAGANPAAAQTGTVSGEVTDATTGGPVAGAQVTVEEANVATITDASGAFTLEDVPAGEVTLEISSLGYAAARPTVEVVAGETVNVSVELRTDALRLEEVVATGTGGEVQRRQVGADLRAVSMDDIREQMPIADLGSALQGRVSGVRSVGTTGGVGAGRELHIRGTSSFLLGQRPVIYIDGVRVDTNNATWSGMADATCCAFDGGAGHERLSDLSPGDIDRIEVLRGAAATTLYGSEASNGVIQIFTRGGEAGMDAQWRAQTGFGVNRHRGHWATKLYPNFTGEDGFRAYDANEHMIENGFVTDYSISVRGGHDDVGYYVSGSFLNEEGSIQPNAQTRGNVRVNLDWRPSDDWAFDITSNYTRNEIEALQSGNNWTALLGNAVLGNPRAATEERPFGEPWVSVADIREMETFSDTDRFTGSLTTSFTPRNNFSHRLTLGLDAVTDQNLRHLPFGNAYVYAGTEGEKNIGYRQFRSYTVDYLGELQFDLSSSLGSSLSFGAQGFWETERMSMATGRGYSGPGVTTVGGGSITFGDEEFEEVINLGVFAQNRFAFDDRLFFTAGFRADGNSAFGEDFGIQFYPKADAAYDFTGVHDLPGGVTSLRLRGALGMSGMTPGAFDQFRTFEPTAVLADVPGVTPGNPGNPELEPERTTEAELGFEAGLFDRLGLDFTWFYSLTTDALLPISLPPSEGFGESQLQNVGETRNKGFEFELSSVNYDSPGLRWSSDFIVDYTDNEVLDLGPAAQDGQLAGFHEGFPVQSQWTNEAVGWDEEAGEHIVSDTAVYFGPQRPEWNFALANTLQFGNFRIYAQLTAERGAVFSNGDRGFRTNFVTGDEYISRLDADGNPTPAADSIFDFHSQVASIDSRDNIRLQEVSVGYQIPERWTGRLGLGTTSVDVSAQNLYWWDDCYCADPNLQYLGGHDSVFSGFLADPQPRRFMARLQTTF